MALQGCNQLANFIYSDPLFKTGEFIIGLARAYNAFGLIGPEHNGIFILDDKEKLVVLDKHFQVSSGYFGADPNQLLELERLSKLKRSELIKFINKNPRSRHTYID